MKAMNCSMKKHIVPTPHKISESKTKQTAHFNTPKHVVLKIQYLVTEKQVTVNIGCKCTHSIPPKVL